MERIRDLTQLNELLGPYLKRRHVTNNFTLPAAYATLIDEGRLFYIRQDGLFLLADMDNYYRFYYHLNDAETNFTVSTDKPGVAEVAFSERKIPPEIGSGCLEKANFKPSVKRLRMVAREEEFQPVKRREKAELPAFRIERAGVERLDGMKELLEKNFDSLTGFLPSRADLEKAVEAGEVFCVLTEGGKEEDPSEIQGVLHMDVVNKTSNLLHIAVADHARNRGIGWALLEKWKEAASQRGVTKYMLWVAEGNQAARKMYESAGFRMDGWHSITLAHDGREKE